RQVFALDIAGLPEAFAESPQRARIPFGRLRVEEADHWYLLRPRRERPRCRAADQRDELAAFHSITSSARASRVGGMSRPSALAVVMLTMRSNFVGCSIGRSPGFAPRRILSTYSAVRRNRSGKLGP